jgi:hypothetical protein
MSYIIMPSDNGQQCILSFFFWNFYKINNTIFPPTDGIFESRALDIYLQETGAVSPISYIYNLLIIECFILYIYIYMLLIIWII